MKKILNNDDYLKFLKENKIEDSKKNRIKYFENKDKKMDYEINNVVCDVENFIFNKYYKEKFKNIEFSNIKLKKFYKYSSYIVGNHLIHENEKTRENDDLRKFILGSAFQFANEEFIKKHYSIYNIFENDQLKRAMEFLTFETREETRDFLIEKEIKKKERSNKSSTNIFKKIYFSKKRKLISDKSEENQVGVEENFKKKISNMENYSQFYENESTNNNFIKKEEREKENY